MELSPAVTDDFAKEFSSASQVDNNLIRGVRQVDVTSGAARLRGTAEDRVSKYLFTDRTRMSTVQRRVAP